jgi:peptidoglycan/LPS O-acetylase OafA/YrhL
MLQEKARTGGISLKSFYLRRTLRIFPACYVFILVVGVLTAVGFVESNRRDFLYAATYTMNYGAGQSFSLHHLWSLAVEEQFYLLWPLTLSLLGTARATRVLAGVIILVPFVRVVRFYVFGTTDVLISTTFETVCDALATGCLLAILLPTLSKSGWYMRGIASRALPLLFAAALVANRQGAHPKLFWVACIPFMNVVIALTISRYALLPHLIGARLLNTRPLVAIGVASYSLYLWQQLFLIQFRTPGSVLQTFPTNVVAVCLCAALSYWVVERPFLRLKGRVRGAAVLPPRRVPGGTECPSGAEPV